ncbi:MAG: hypothetical protein AB1762_13630, partial [Gemmatimonadota bacterium]
MSAGRRAAPFWFLQAAFVDDSPSPIRRWLLIAIASVLFAATVELLPSAGARLRIVLVLTAAWFGLSAWVGRRALLERPYAPTVPVLLLLSYAFIGVAAIAAGESPVDTDRLAAYCAMSVGWATLFLLVGLRPAGSMRLRVSAPSRRSVLVVIGAAAAIVLLAHGLATPRWPLISDEAIYYLQSEWFFRPNYSWQVPREIADFFVMRKFGYNAEAQHFYGMYPPGWPAVLALLNAIGLRWWAPVVMGTATVGLTYVVGRRVHSARTGLIAAGLLALQQWWLIDHAGYMSDGFLTFTTIAGAAALLAAETASAARRVGFGWLGGLALGMGVAARPLSGLALGAAVALWILIRKRMPWSGFAQTTAGIALGGVAPAVLLLHYNAATNGEALRLAYQAIHGHGYDLGFGLRGFQAYTATLERVQVPVNYTPAAAVSHLFLRLSEYAYAAFGIGLLLPLLATARVNRVALRLRHVVPFLLLPAVYFFYWYSGVRYFTCLLPFVLIGCVALVLELLEKDPWIALGMLLCAFVGSLFFALPYRSSPGGLDSPWTRSAYFRDPGRMATLDSLNSLGAREGPLLVFARQQDNPFDN